MSISINFTPDQRRISDLGDGAEELDDGVMENNVLWLGVSIDVDGIDLLEPSARPHPDGPVEGEGFSMREVSANGGSASTIQPAIGFVVRMAAALERLVHEPKVEVMVAWGRDLTLHRVGDEVEIRSTDTGKYGRVGLVELRTAFSEFRSRLAEWLSTSVPSLKHHQSWTRWFPSE